MIEGGGVKSLNYSSTQTCFKELSCLFSTVKPAKLSKAFPTSF